MGKSHFIMKVSELLIYPIKSTAPIELQSSNLTKYGLEYDRRWALYGADGQVLTGRQHPKLLDIQCRITEDSCIVHYNHAEIVDLSNHIDPSAVAESVKIFSYDAYGSPVSIEVDDWFSNFIGKPCRLLKVNTSRIRPVLEKHGGLSGDIVAFADQAPILIISEGSLLDLNTRLDKPILMNRFRPNIIVEGATAYAEDSWDIIKIGSISLRVIQQCERCIFTTIDPITKKKDINKEPLTTLSKYRKGPRGGITFGVHAVPIDSGTIKVDDEVMVSTCKDHPVVS